MGKQPLYKKVGFTLIELLVVVALIGMLVAVVLASLVEVRESAYEARALSELKSFAGALETYLTVNLTGYPPDVARGIPSGVEENLAGGKWPDAPWPESVYDWDAYTVDGQEVHQLSIRFCPLGGSLSDCRFPDEDWAENFDVNSSFFYCFNGPCQAHPSRPADHPGYCINCACKQMEDC